MATSKTRQRKLARAKFDRQLARRADRERSQRQIRAAIAGVLALSLIVLGGLWLGGVFDKDPAPLAAADDCTWNELDVAGNGSLRAEGIPAKTGIAKTGTANMSVAMKTGETTATVAIELDRSKAKCASAALSYLAGKNYYANTKCHKLTNGDGSFALACGDHSETGNGGAAFGWYPENFPTEPAAPTPTANPTASPGATPGATPGPTQAPAAVRYKRGDVVMVPTTNGSQFLIFYKDSTIVTNYSIVGRVTNGLSFIDQVAAAGTVEAGNGKPKNDVIIQTLTVVPVTTALTPSATPQPSATVTPAS